MLLKQHILLYCIFANSFINQVLPTCLAPLITKGLRLWLFFHDFNLLNAYLSIVNPLNLSTIICSKSHFHNEKLQNYHIFRTNNCKKIHNTPLNQKVVYPHSVLIAGNSIEISEIANFSGKIINIFKQIIVYLFNLA